jgi:hypothetical protein
MPYIKTETVAAIRKSLKENFPKFKFSVRREHYSSVNIRVISGPVKFTMPEGRDYIQVNPFWYHTQHEGQTLKFLEKLFNVVDSVEMRRTVSEDADYGSIPNYYLNVSIGDWATPYIVKK